MSDTTTIDRINEAGVERINAAIAYVANGFDLDMFLEGEPVTVTPERRAA